MTVPTPNKANLYRARDASDYSGAHSDALHQSAYLRQDGASGTQLIYGEAYVTGWSTWDVFVPVMDTTTSTITLQGAKIPITLIVIDDLGEETSFNMGNSNATQVLTPPADRSYDSARIIRRF